MLQAARHALVGPSYVHVVRYMYDVVIKTYKFRGDALRRVSLYRSVLMTNNDHRKQLNPSDVLHATFCACSRFRAIDIDI